MEPFVVMIHEIVDLNPWAVDENSIIRRKIDIDVFGHEASIRVNYLMGNAFIRGMIGNHEFQIQYRSHSGFQLRVSESGEKIDDEDQVTFSGPPYMVDQMLKALYDAVN